jgi:anti-sigma B factor antagonist
MDITQREKEGIVILDLSGRLIVGDPVTDLREKITSLASETHTNIILNMAYLDYIDSTGLGGMVICFTSLKKAGGALKLLKLNKRNADLLVLTKLNTIFQIFDDEQDAVNSFFPNREIRKFDILDFVQQHVEET